MTSRPQAVSRALKPGPAGLSTVRIGLVDSVDTDGSGLPRAWVDLGDGNLIEAPYGDHISNLAADDVVRVLIGPGVAHVFDRLVESSPPTGEWDTWSPTPGNLTVGDGDLECRYDLNGRSFTFAVNFEMGSSSTMGSSPTIDLPVDLELGGLLTPFAAWAYDSSTGTHYPGVAYSRGVGNTELLWRAAFPGAGTITASVPFTWAVGDQLRMAGTLEVQPA